MRILKTLEKKKMHRKKSRSIEYIFFKENAYLLKKYPYFNHLFSSDKSFKTIQENIIIRSLHNKEVIDKVVLDYKNKCLQENIKPKQKEVIDLVNDAIKDLVYLVDEENHRIYLPFFSKSLNIMYVDQPFRLLNYPYSELLNDFSSSIVDTFEEYNYKLYNSLFSKMLPIIGDKTSLAFFNVDDYVIYVINNQGRLDVKIPLYDRHMKRFNIEQIMERVTNLMKVFYSNDKKKFLDFLYEERFISFFMYRKLKGKVK